MVTAPILDEARMMVEAIVGRPCDDADVLAWQRDHHVECRELPLKADVLNNIVLDAVALCRQLADAGVEFAGTPEQAARIVAGTVYAAWRSSIENDYCETEPAFRHSATLQATRLSLDHARHHVTGMPAMYRWEYLSVVAGSDDPVDGLPLGGTLAALWPDRYAEGNLGGSEGDRAAEVQDGAADCGLADEMLANAPNIFDDVTEQSRLA